MKPTGARPAESSSSKKSNTQLRKVGVHHYGLCLRDLVKDVDGQPSWDGSFALLGKLAKDHQLIWEGGDWGRPNVKHSFIDQPHVQWCSVADQTKLFAGTWYPDSDYNPYQHL